MILELYTYGDTELFYAAGQDGSWSLPLYVYWRHDKANDIHYGLVSPAVGLYHSQHLALTALLQVHDIQGRKDHWLVPRKIIEAVLHKATGITPLHYYKWPEPNSPAIKLPSVLRIDDSTLHPFTDKQELHDPFAAHLSEKTGLQLGIVKLVLKAICDEAPTWLLERRRSLELGFCRLIAAPLRPNWKEIVSFKFKKWKLLKMFTAPNGVKEELLEAAGLPAAFCSMHNIGIKKSSQRYRVSYTLEAIPYNRFEKEVDRVERKRLTLGGTSYVASFEKTVEHLYHHLLAALENYLHKTSLPFARLFESGGSGQLRLLPTTSQSVKVRGVPIRQLPVHIVSPSSHFSVLAEKSDELLVRAEAPEMPPLPDLLSPPADVRESEESGCLDKSGDEGKGTGGVHVPDGDQGEDSRKPVLPPSECSTWITGLERN